MRALLATALIVIGALVLSACTAEEEPDESLTSTPTPVATIKGTKTATATPAGAAVSATPRHQVGRPNIPSSTAIASPAQTVVTQPTAASQPTAAPQPTVVPQPTAPPPTAPPPTVVVVTVVVATPTPPTPTPVVTPTPPPAVTAPIVFRGTVVGAPEEQEPIDGPCGYTWWVVRVAVDEVLKNAQTDGGCGFSSYAPGETIDVLYFAEYVPVGSGDYVEVSGEEGMFSCACECCCDGCGLLVRVEIAGSYIRSL